LMWLESGIEAILWSLIVGQLSRFSLTVMFSQKAYSLNYQTNGLFALLLLTVVFLLTSQLQKRVETSLLMLFLQPLGIAAVALRFGLISTGYLKAFSQSINRYLGKSL
ncbi:lipopolysaccharide biosynthesis protein, partial [Vibrio sp. M260118]